MCVVTVVALDVLVVIIKHKFTLPFYRCNLRHCACLPLFICPDSVTVCLPAICTSATTPLSLSLCLCLCLSLSLSLSLSPLLIIWPSSFYLFLCLSPHILSIFLISLSYFLSLSHPSSLPPSNFPSACLSVSSSLPSLSVNLSHSLSLLSVLSLSSQSSDLLQRLT